MNRRGIIAFFAVLIAIAGLAWVGGYNFDQRSPTVAYFSAIALVAACIAYSLAATSGPDALIRELNK